jgi:hypothetical protein
VIARAKKGEPMTKAKAKEVMRRSQRQAEAPPRTVARLIAIATGKGVACRDVGQLRDAYGGHDGVPAPAIGA